MTFRERLRSAAGVALWVALAAAASWVLTFLLLPVWRWLEESSGIESVGHSGPADWCFYATFAVVCGGLLLGTRWLRKQPQQPAG